MNQFTKGEAETLALEISTRYTELTCSVREQEVPALEGLPAWSYSYIAIWKENSLIATVSEYAHWETLKEFAAVIVHTDEQLAQIQYMDGLIS